MDIQVGDILTMKKQHPCGEKRWEDLCSSFSFGFVGSVMAHPSSFLTR